MGLELLDVFGRDWPYLFFSITIITFFSWLFSGQVENDTQADSKENQARPELKNRLCEGVIIGFYLIGEVILSSRLTLYLSQEAQLSERLSSIYLSLFFGLLLIGRFTLIFVNWEIPSAKILTLSLCSTLLSFLIGMFIHPLGLALCGLTMSVFFPAAMTYLNEKYSTSINAMMAFVVTASSICLICAHWLFGIISDTFAVKTALFLAPAALSIALFMHVFQEYTKRHKSVL